MKKPDEEFNPKPIKLWTDGPAPKLPDPVPKPKVTKPKKVLRKRIPRPVHLTELDKKFLRYLEKQPKGQRSARIAYDMQIHQSVVSSYLQRLLSKKQVTWDEDTRRYSVVKSLKPQAEPKDDAIEREDEI